MRALDVPWTTWMAISTCQDSSLLVFPLGNADNPNLTHGALTSCIQPQIFRKSWHVKELNIWSYVHAQHLVFIQPILPMYKLSSTKCVNWIWIPGAVNYSVSHFLLPPLFSTWPNGLLACTGGWGSRPRVKELSTSNDQCMYKLK
jgi:hypothetical protein